MENKNLFRKIKSIDEYVQNYLKNFSCEHPRKIVVNATRAVIDNIKSNLRDCSDPSIIDPYNVLSAIDAMLKTNYNISLNRVINATGTILHTNLGRSLLSKNTAEKIYMAATNYVDLEVDIISGKRTTRGAQIVNVLKQITGCEDAIIVNNNAAAMFFILSAFAKNTEVIISRGELVEIGGSFRIPDVMTSSGAVLREVGSTNKTVISDYKNAINENSSIIMKVHTSNYKVIGFTANTELNQLKELAVENNLMLVHDVGSGSLINLSENLGVDEPNVIDSISDGADLVCFSCDKLLGGSQAGLIIGKHEYITQLRKHPLMRVLRVDKLTMISVLETLKEYLYPDTLVKNLPTLNMLFMQKEEILEKAEYFSDKLLNYMIENSIVESSSTCGGGSIPCKEFSTYLVQLTSSKIPSHILLEKLRKNKTPIIARIVNNFVSFDLRTVSFNDIDLIVECLKGLYDE